MIRKSVLLIILALCLQAAMPPAHISTRTAAAARGPLPKPETRREVAVTFDDLPIVAAARQDIASYRESTERLLNTITQHHIPAVGFVNEIKLYERDAVDEARVALLRMWLDAGLELGNHTFSHPDFHSTPLSVYERNVVRGETTTKQLLNARGKRLRYFRHPFLRTGRDIETKRAFERFLSERGYQVAPVTIDNSEWIFADAYAKAARRGDTQMMKRIGDAYVPYMEQVFEYFEWMSREVFGYEVKQVLLLHANALNADYFDQLVSMMKRRGYKFISLEEALTDKAYRLPDNYTGPKGISWLRRWGSAKGFDKKEDPETPAFVMQEAGVSGE